MKTPQWIQETVNRDLAIIRLEQLSKPKTRSPIAMMIDEATGYDKVLEKKMQDNLLESIECVETIIKANEYLEYDTKGMKELLEKLNELLPKQSKT